MTVKWAKFGLLMVGATLAVIILVTWLYGLQVKQSPVTLSGPPFCVGLEGQVPDCPATPAP